jgi:hypothetical protein
MSKQIWCCCVGIEVSGTVGIIGLNIFELTMVSIVSITMVSLVFRLPHESGHIL